MNKQKSNNFIAAVLGNKKISRVVLMAYILAPIFIFAVGFASWTIVTPEFGFITSGSFVGNQLLDSTKYISLHDDNVPFTATTTVGGFVVEDEDSGEYIITDKTTLGVKFKIQLGQCQALFSNSSDERNLYFTFALCFADREEAELLFDIENFDVAVTIGGTAVTTGGTEVIVGGDSTGVIATIKSFQPEKNADFATEAATSSTYVFVMQLHFPADGESGYKLLSSNIVAELAIDYTLTPQSAEQYRDLMDVVFGTDGKSKSLMSDIRITDYEPYVMETE